MPNINDAFPSTYLKASDIRGSEPVVTIDRVEYEPVGRQREMKAVVYFKGKEKGVVLNKTNATKIVQLAGSAQTEDWDGCRIRLFATETEFGGETVECIRIKAAPPNGTRTAATTPPPPKPAFKPKPAAPPSDYHDDSDHHDHSEPLNDDDIPF